MGAFELPEIALSISTSALLARGRITLTESPKMAEHELVGKRAPKYRVHPVGKSSRQSQDWKEITDPKKPTAFLWWTPTCSSCKPALDVFAKYAKRLGAKVNFVTVCTAAVKRRDRQHDDIDGMKNLWRSSVFGSSMPRFDTEV